MLIRLRAMVILLCGVVCCGMRWSGVAQRVWLWEEVMKPVDVSGVFWCWVPERKQVRRLSARKDRPPPHHFNAHVPVSKGEER